MGLAGGIGRTLSIPLLLLNLIFAVIILGLGSHYLDKAVVGKLRITNGATPTFILLSLISAAVAVASYIAGAHHLRLYRSDSGASAQATAWVAWFLLILAFVLAWKEIHIGGRPVKLRVLEAFVIMLTVTHFIYTLLQHMGNHNETTAGTHNPKPLNPNAPAAASAV